jgi:acyl carrier protein
MDRIKRAGALSPTEFIEHVTESLKLPGPIRFDTRLFEDLSLDSLSTYELLLAVEELGVEIDEGQWIAVQTIEDCFKRYREAIDGGR